MRFRATTALVIAFATSLGIQGHAQDRPRTQEPIRAGATFVRVDVYPTRDGKPVKGLTAADFEVREDGVPQEIQSFEHIEVPVGASTELRDPDSQREMERQAANPRARVVVIFLDVPHVSLAGSHAIIEPLILLMNRLLGPNDLIGVMTPDMRARDVVLTRKTATIEEQLRENWDWGMATDMTLRLNDYENKIWVCYPPRGGEGEISPLAAALIAKSRQTRSLHAMQDLVTHLGSIREERKAVIAVSSGWQLIRDSEALMRLRENEVPPGVDDITVGPNGKLTRRDPRTTGGGDFMAKSECDAERMRLAQTDNQQEFRDLLDDANRANASFYPVDPQGLRTSSSGSLDRLYELASNTDGIPIVNTNDLNKGIGRIVADLTSYYLVGYTSTNTKSDGRVRHIQVKVKGSGIQVRHRRSYRAPSPETASGPPAPSAVPDAAARTLSDAIASLSRKPVDTRFSIAAAHLTSGNEATIWIAGQVAPPSGAPDEFLAGGRADLEIQAGAHSTRAQATIEPGQRGFVTSVKLPVSAATELNVRARASSDASAAPVTAAFASRIGPGLEQPLLLTRGPATGNRYAATADRYFTRNERIRVELPVAPVVKLAGARLLDKNGVQLRPAVTSSERVDDATGQRWVTADLALAVLGAGDYAIEVTLDDAGAPRKVITAFRVTR